MIINTGCSILKLTTALTIFIGSGLVNVAGLKRGNCSGSNVSCENGECISSFDECDGVSNCPDDSDETHAGCFSRGCPVGSFRCAYGGCIAMAGKCDGVKDCRDNSDELICPSLQSLDVPSPLCSGTFGFQCRNGECISGSSCDGAVDCRDGSDETIAACYNDKATSCPHGSFQCAYGACISISGKCDSKDDCADGSDEHYLLCNRTKVQEPKSFCRLPHFEGTLYRCKENSDTLNCNLKAGDLIANREFVFFRCQDGFVDTTALNPRILHCADQKWNTRSNLTALCDRVCPPLTSSLINFNCSYKSRVHDCSKSYPGTIATAVCKEGYKARKPSDEFSCLPNAEWEPFDHHCEKSCGVIDPKVNVSDVVLGNPWNVGIYVQNKGKFIQFCSGTLISSNKVLTAANCMINQNNNKLRPKSRIRIGLGKYHNDFENSQDTLAQIREIVLANLSDKYLGSFNNYYHDVAVLKLSTEVEINNHVLPICIDMNRLYKLTSDMFGSMVGWHLYDSSSSNSIDEATKCKISNEDKRLKSGRIPYMPRDECMRKYLSSYLTPDKFCAFSPEGANETAVCNFDSGAGLTFKINNVHYIYGIVTTLVKRVNIRGTRHFINTFTDVSEDDNLNFIIGNMNP